MCLKNLRDQGTRITRGNIRWMVRCAGGAGSPPVEHDASGRGGARGANARGRTEPTLGPGHHGYPSVGRSEGTLGNHDQLRGSDGIGLALCHAIHGRGSGRDAAGRCEPTRRHIGLAVRAGNGSHPLPQAPAESTVEQVGQGLLWQLQAGLCISGVPRNLGRGAPGGTTQRLENAVAGRVLCGVISQKQDMTCPQLSGAVQQVVRGCFPPSKNTDKPQVTMCRRSQRHVNRSSSYTSDARERKPIMPKVAFRSSSHHDRDRRACA